MQSIRRWWNTFLAWFHERELSENAILLTFAVAIGLVGALGVILRPVRVVLFLDRLGDKKDYELSGGVVFRDSTGFQLQTDRSQFNKDTGIANAAKHAGASAVDVTVERDHDRLIVSIQDDGIGGASIGAGSGLTGLADRASALGGSLSVHSPSGGGTRLSVDLPIS